MKYANFPESIESAIFLKKRRFFTKKYCNLETDLLNSTKFVHNVLFDHLHNRPKVLFILAVQITCKFSGYFLSYNILLLRSEN